MKKLGSVTVIGIVMFVAALLAVQETRSAASAFIVNSAAPIRADKAADTAYYGNYRITANHQLGISRFITDDGTIALLFSDYSTGIVRRLFANGRDRFVMGPGFNTLLLQNSHLVSGGMNRVR